MKKKTLTGKFIANERGFGFVECENNEKDFFIPPQDTNGAMTGDTVKMVVKKEAIPGNRAEGKVIEVLQRATQTLVGTFEKSKNFGFVVPDDRNLGTDIFIPQSQQRKAKNGDKVVVTITQYPGKGKSAEGKIVEILGKANDTNVDILSVIRAHHYSLTFPKDVEKEAKMLPAVIHGIEERVDLREKEIFTIDGDDTKDIDDAISLNKKGRNYVLGVHIADVSHYVTMDSAIDKEALKRGTSVYLIDTVLPMLPTKLSNGICSLNPGEDRYALSVEMEITPKGKVVKSRIFKSVIRSQLQMTYHKVYDILENGIIEDAYRPHVKTLQRMRELAQILMAKKEREGAIQFDIPEAKIQLDENDAVLEIHLREMTIANQMIEQFMIVANETVAKTFWEKEAPFIYRIHEKPAIDKIDRLNTFLSNRGYPEIEKITHQNLNHVRELATQRGEETLVSLMLLRTMQLAKYSHENWGHFGLASSYYCHFTSPIRRYPDLFIHRVISTLLAGEMTTKMRAKYRRQAVKFAAMASEREQEEEEAERELYELKKCEYMEKHIGEEFDGVVSGVTSFGIFVELPNTVEGLCRVEEMKDDYYYLVESTMQLVGRHTKKTWQLGDKVRVKCIHASKQMQRIDFAIVE